MTTAGNCQRGLQAGEEAAMRRVYLHPGQIVTSSEPLMITTILGSCVSICMWDPEVLAGGINHFLLPRNPLPGQSDLRYGNTATERLIDELLALGARKPRIVAKLVGGASTLGGSSGSRQSIGEQNVAVARQLLARHGIHVGGEQTGGTRGRRLHFHTASGFVFSKEI